MSEYKDRGIIKWAPFDALSGHGALLEDLIFNLNKKEKAILSDDEYEELNKTVSNAYNNQKTISIEYYNNGYSYQTFGLIKKIDSVKKVIKMETGESIFFSDVLKAKLLKWGAAMKRNAYAKINLFLNVKNKREDGYHDLEMVNITVGLCDEIEYTLTESEIICETSIQDLNSKNNLAYKAAVFMKKVFGVKSGVKIYIKKNIPVGGGLGGGSSDAATTIEALNELWNLNLSFNEMFELSKNFGSDTPYCLYKGPAIVRGRGFDIEPLDLDISEYEISLFSPKINVSTGTIFNNLISFNKYNLEECFIVVGF